MSSWYVRVWLCVSHDIISNYRFNRAVNGSVFRECVCVCCSDTFNFKPIFDHFQVVGCYPLSRNPQIRFANLTHTLPNLCKIIPMPIFMGANLISFSFLPLHWSEHWPCKQFEFSLFLLVYLVVCSFGCCPFVFCLMHWKRWPVSFIDAWPHM